MPSVENLNDCNSNMITHPSLTISVTDNPRFLLKKIKISNANRLVIAHININSLRNKFIDLQFLIKDNIDVLLVTETKLDISFPTSQFIIEGYSTPFRFDRDHRGGGVILYTREDLPCREFKINCDNNALEGIFLELNLRKTKWLIFGGYNFNKCNIEKYLFTLGKILDNYMSKYEHFLFLGDFNSETTEHFMKEFCLAYNLHNLVKEPTCYKNPLKPSLIDLILTNKTGCFQHTQTIETGLSDHHKMTLTVLRTSIPKQAPIMVTYRNYKTFDPVIFSHELNEKLNEIDNANVNYEVFRSNYTMLLNEHAPVKKKLVRANNAPFMTKHLSKAIMNRSRLRNKFLKTPNSENDINYKRQRNYCANLSKKEKKKIIIIILILN